MLGERGDELRKRWNEVSGRGRKVERKRAGRDGGRRCDGVEGSGEG